MKCCLLKVKAFETPPHPIVHANNKLLSKIYQNMYQNDPFSSVVTSGMPLNQLYTPAEPTPACAERRYTNARVTAKPTLATSRYR